MLLQQVFNKDKDYVVNLDLNLVESLVLKKLINLKLNKKKLINKKNNKKKKNKKKTKIKLCSNFKFNVLQRISNNQNQKNNDVV